MFSIYKYKFIVILLIAMPAICFTQQQKQIGLLQQLAVLYNAKEQQDNEKLMAIAQQKGWDLMLRNKTNNTLARLTGIDSKGFPLYTTTNNNVIAAATTHTSYLWQNGLNLSGSSLNIKGKIAVWDEGAANNNHIEIAGRIVNKDFSSNANHSTHIAGTLIANGTNPSAKGMAYGATQLLNYDYNNHISEMASQANNLLVSNHSYGNACGWSKLQSATYWTYYGLPGDTADYKFGIYNADCEMFDSIAYNAQNYLIVKSVGNNRDKNGPLVGQDCYVFNDTGALILKPRPSGISSNNSYDNIPTYGVAKNILTVGAVESIASGSTKTSDIKMSSFSSWGPTDDGRIKPDIVADGVDVLSCTSDGNTTYESYSGTSMAAPNVTGSLFLLQELYSKKNSGSFMKAATLKALAIHTANESGNADGPDYTFGWGLLNAEKAANMIAGKDTGFSKMIEATLNNNDTFKLNVIASGNGKLMATIVWADIAGEPTITNLLNNPTLKLVNDLDIRIVRNNITFFPWNLNPATPNAAAIKADNFRDNVEKIEVNNAIPGEAYTLQITHKGILQRSLQNFSLIVSGIGNNAYCLPYTINNNTVRIDSVKLANTVQTNIICNDYNYTGKTILLQPSKNHSLSIGLSNCNNSGNDKIAKLFIDYNNNGSFNDANELVFTSNIFTGNGIVNASITTPDNITIGNTTLMRLIVAETNNANSFNACSSGIMNGSTEDYLVKFINPAIDVEVTSLEIPSTNYCSNNLQYVSTRITNKGDSTVENIALTATVKSGVTIIAALNGVYTPKLTSGESIVYTFQNPFTTTADSNYTITITVNVVNDQVASNNITTSTFTIKPTPQIVSGQANVCNNIASLKVFGASNTQTYAWYNNATSNMPVAFGGETSTSIISNKYYLNTGLNTSIGAINKSISTNGDYQAKGGNYFYYTATTPVLLQSAKLYTAYPGKVFIKVADTIRTYSDGTYDYTTLNIATINVLASRPIQASGNVNGNDVSDTGLVYNINLLLPKGNHILIVSTDSVANIFRNKSISVKPYPYIFPNLLTITGNNATYQDSFYYYLYNMKIRTLDCESEKYEVNTSFAALPTITKVGDSLVSSLGTNYQWQKNGVDIIGETNQKYLPTSDGNYSVIITGFNGCRQSSKVYQPNITNDVNIYPNPTKDYVNIQFNSSEIAFTQIDIYDILGRKYISKISTSTTNSFYNKLNVALLPNGIYFIKILHGESSFVKKLIIAR